MFYDVSIVRNDTARSSGNDTDDVDAKTKRFADAELVVWGDSLREMASITGADRFPTVEGVEKETHSEKTRVVLSPPSRSSPVDLHPSRLPLSSTYHTPADPHHCLRFLLLALKSTCVPTPSRPFFTLQPASSSCESSFLSR